MTYYLLTLIATNFIITYTSYLKSKHNQFYTDTIILSPLGIYVWGDGLVLAPFWIASATLAILFKLTLLWLVRYHLIFWIVRSGYEVIYWLAHQAANSDYTPPIGRHTPWLKTNDARIIYQLIHTCVVVLSLFGLFYSFTVR